MSGPPFNRDHRYGYVDSLRGFAAFAVVYYHGAAYYLTNGYRPPGWEGVVFTTFVDWIDLGKIAVTLFFCISGFVVPFSLFAPSATLRTFAVSRFFRLYPAYWLSLFLGVACAYVVEGKVFDARTVLINVTMLQQFLGVPNILGVYWTLQMELIFYVLCAALFALGLLRSPKAVFVMALGCISGALLLAAGRYITHIKLPVGLLMALFVMFEGMLWRRSLLEKTPDVKRLAAVGLALFIALVPIISVLAYSSDYGFHETWYRYTIAYYAAMGIFIVGTRYWLIESPSVVGLGRISYSLYLFGPIAQSIVFSLPLMGALRYWAHVPILASCLLAIAFAYIVFHLVERPGIALGRRIAAGGKAVAMPV